MLTPPCGDRATKRPRNRRDAGGAPAIGIAARAAPSGLAPSASRSFSAAVAVSLHSPFAGAVGVG